MVYVPQDHKLLVVGISLGGSVLLYYLGERGTDVRYVTAAATVSAPLDMRTGGATLSKDFNMVYTHMFLRILKAKANAKLDQHPGLYGRTAMIAVHMLGQFNNLVTVPLHGLHDVFDYWTRASSKPMFREVCVPALMLNARNGPLLSGQHLLGAAEVSFNIALDQPLHGNHVGFLLRHGKTDRVDWMPACVLCFFDDVLARPKWAGDTHG